MTSRNGNTDDKHVVVVSINDDEKKKLVNSNSDATSSSCIIEQQRGLSDERIDAMWEECATPHTFITHSQINNADMMDPPSQLTCSFLQKEKEQGHCCSIDFDVELAQPNTSALNNSSSNVNRNRRPLSDHLAERAFSLTPKISISPDPSSQSRNNSMSRQETVALLPKDEAQTERKLADETNRLEAAKNALNDDKTDASPAALPKEPENHRSSSGISVDLGKPVRRLSSKLTKKKTNSRLVEAAAAKMKTDRDMKGEAKSAGTSGRASKAVEEEDEDPFKDIDLPQKYKSMQCGLASIMQLAALVLTTAGLVCSLIVRVLKEHLIWGLHLWRWVLLILVVFCGRFVSGWLIHVAVFFLERNFLLRKKVLYFVYGLRKGVQNCLWLGLLLLAWNLLFDRKVARSTKNSKVLSIVTKLFECFLIGAVIWLGKLLLVKVLASSFHVSTYFERIQDSIFHQYVLERLLGPPLIELQLTNNATDIMKGDLVMAANSKEMSKDDTNPKPKVQVHLNAPLQKSGFIGIGEKCQRKLDNKSGEIKQNEAISVDQFHKLNTQNVSAWNMKRLINRVRHPSITAFARTIDESIMGEEDVEISSETQAKAAAKMIFKNVAKPGFRDIDEGDFLHFISETDVIRVLPLFEGANETGKITKKSLKNWVVSVYQERRSLSHSLNDTRTAVHELHRLISLIVAVIIIIISLLILELATTHMLVIISSQLLLVVFMFGNTCKQAFEAIIFLFIMHPYDVGDRVVIDNVQMIVEEMKILYTVFLRYDNEKIYYPNSVLATKAISNFYRSPNMGDSFDFSIHISTPLKKIAELKRSIASYIESNPSLWNPDKHTIVVKEIEDCNRLKMSLWIQHTLNFQNIGEKWIRRSDLLLEIKTYFEELGIEYRLLPQEIHLCDARVTNARNLDL